MSDNGDDEVLAVAGASAAGEAGLAAVGAVVAGAAGLAAVGASAGRAVYPNMDEEHDTNLPVLTSIWECPNITKVTGFDDNGTSYAGWTCGWCPLENNGSKPKPFRTMNATKALGHVAKISGYDIRPCRGRIPAATSRQYQELYLSKTVTKEQRKNKKDVMNNKIANMQDRTVFSLAEGANSSSRHDKALATYNNQLNGGPLAVE